MFSVMPAMPIFSDFSYLPARPSPLSSPIRASSPSRAPPLSPSDPNRRRQAQSSPLQPKPSVSRFAARPARPNPVVRNREAAQQNRRGLFLKGVQQRADDRRWERRGVEQKVLSTEWFNETLARQQAKWTDPDSLLTDKDIEDAERLEEEQMRQFEADDIPDDVMALDGMVDGDGDSALESSMSTNALQHQQSLQTSSGVTRPSSPQWSDDDEYDSLFMDILSTQDGNPSQAASQDVEMA